MSLRIGSIYSILRFPLFSSSVYIIPIRYSSEISFAKLKQAYVNLGLDESASLDEIKSRFAKLAKLYHPDTGGVEVNKISAIWNIVKSLISGKSSKVIASQSFFQVNPEI